MNARDDPRPLGGYLVLMGAYTALTGAAIYALRGRRGRVRRPAPMDLLLFGLATQHLSRLVSKDAVTSPLRAPFTEFEGAAGEGEVEERVVGSGLRHALGEFVTCPFCLDQWIATIFVAAWVALPDLTTAATTALAVAQVADYLQLGYGALRRRQ
ncbi:MAG TPA: DUF1360 domain-containing protein [Acidimicrobiales bacterium]|nr:DUF1360 domain-containing protein [Acidimicrobiales bacterium]